MATLSEILKEQIANKRENNLDRGRVGTLPVETPVLDSLKSRDQLPTLQQALGKSGVQGTYTPPEVVAPESVPNANVFSQVLSGANKAATLPSGAQPPAGLSQFSPAEQTAIKNDAVKSGLTSYNVEFRQPSVGGVRSLRAEAPVVAPTVETAPAAPSGVEAYTARTGKQVGLFDDNATPFSRYMAATAGTTVPEDKYGNRDAAISDALNSPEAKAFKASMAEVESRRAKGLPVDTTKIPDWKAAYEARTGVNFDAVQRSPKPGDVATTGNEGRYVAETPAEVAERRATFQDYMNSPEGQAAAKTDAAERNTPTGFTLETGNAVETWRPLGVGEVSTAERDYRFEQAKIAQQQRDYLSAVQKPVGATLTQGEADALKVGERALQNEGAKTVADINAGAQIGSARIGADAGRNKLLDLAVQDINATTDPVLKASKLQQYLGGKAATPTSDPLAKTYLELMSMQSPQAQADFAQGMALGIPAAQAYSDVIKKYSKKEK